MGSWAARIRTGPHMGSQHIQGKDFNCQAIALGPKVYLFLLKSPIYKEERQRKRCCSCWLTPQVVTMAGAETSRSQKFRLGLLHGCRISRVWASSTAFPGQKQGVDWDWSIWDRNEHSSRIPTTSKARTLATRIPCEASKDIFKAQHTQRKIGKWGFTETKSLCIANENIKNEDMDRTKCLQAIHMSRSFPECMRNSNISKAKKGIIQLENHLQIQSDISQRKAYIASTHKIKTLNFSDTQ